MPKLLTFPNFLNVPIFSKMSNLKPTQPNPTQPNPPTRFRILRKSTKHPGLGTTTNGCRRQHCLFASLEFQGPTSMLLGILKTSQQGEFVWTAGWRKWGVRQGCTPLEPNGGPRKSGNPLFFVSPIARGYLCFFFHPQESLDNTRFGGEVFCGAFYWHQKKTTTMGSKGWDMYLR